MEEKYHKTRFWTVGILIGFIAFQDAVCLLGKVLHAKNIPAHK